MHTILQPDAAQLQRAGSCFHERSTTALAAVQGLATSAQHGRSLAGKKARALGAPRAGKRAHTVVPALPATASGYGVQPHGSEAKRREGYPTGQRTSPVGRQCLCWPCGLVVLCGATSRNRSQRATDAASRHGKQVSPEIHRNLVTEFVYKSASGVHNSPFFSLSLKEFPMKSTTCKSTHRIKYDRRMAIKRAAFKELQHRALIGQRFKELFLQTGLGFEGVAQTLHVTPRTVRNWLSGKTSVPYSAYKLLRVQRYFELPGEGWDGWHMHSGKLWSPEGYGFLPKESSWWSLLVRQARSFKTLYEENNLLKRNNVLSDDAAESARRALRSVTPHFSPQTRNFGTPSSMPLFNGSQNPGYQNALSPCPAELRYARVQYSQNLFKGGI